MKYAGAREVWKEEYAGMNEVGRWMMSMRESDAESDSKREWRVLQSPYIGPSL